MKYFYKANKISWLMPISGQTTVGHHAACGRPLIRGAISNGWQIFSRQTTASMPFSSFMRQNNPV